MAVMHPLGYRIDPERGLVIGKRGMPIRGRSGHGYVQVQVKRNCVRVRFSAHRMIWEAVNGPIPPGMEINHINGIHDDNRIANLEVVTPSENIKHAFRTGLMRANGEFNGRAIGKRRLLEAAK